MNSRLKGFNVLLVIAVILAVSFLQLPKAYSTVATSDTAASNKALAFMANVVGLDIAKYSAQVQVSNFTGNEVFDNGHFDNRLFDKIVKYSLTSAGSKVEVISLLRNDTVVWCKLYPIEGSPLFALTPSTNGLLATKGVLSRLQNYQPASYLATMRGMLDTVPSRTNSTTTVGNVRQAISFGANSEDTEWSYSPNGIENTFKAVTLGLQNGSFAYFSDNWNLYTIGDMNVNVPEAQAVNIAKQAAINKYSASGNQTSSNFTILDQNAMATLTMQDRGNYSLYPHWEILLPLDKAYGAITAIRALVWADTGQVAFVAAVGNGGAPQTSQNSAAADSTANSATPTSAPASTEQSYAIIGTLVTSSMAVVGYVFIKRRR